MGYRGICRSGFSSTRLLAAGASDKWRHALRGAQLAWPANLRLRKLSNSPKQQAFSSYRYGQDVTRSARQPVFCPATCGMVHAPRLESCSHSKAAPSLLSFCLQTSLLSHPPSHPLLLLAVVTYSPTARPSCPTFYLPQKSCCRSCVGQLCTFLCAISPESLGQRSDTSLRRAQYHS